MDFNALAVEVKELHTFSKKDLVYYKVNSDEVQELFKDHTKFPKGANETYSEPPFRTLTNASLAVLSKTDTKIQAVLTIHFGGIVSVRVFTTNESV